MSRQRRAARDLRPKAPKAVTAAIGNGEEKDSLDELALLLKNLGVPVAARVIQKRRAPDPASFIGAGKAQEIKEYAELNGVTHLVVDDFISPTQKSNLQKRTGLQVWDRGFVIMKIFERRADTAEAKLQVELAQYRYEIPGLKGLGRQMSRTGGGIGTRGPGETEFERHRRKLELRIKSITKRLEDVRRRRGENRERRKRGGVPLAALVGYTNSGKSTLLRALSKDGGILAKDQLFSTLDTVVRRIETVSRAPFLLSDTVGFIRKLPPELIAAFRATLEEAANADLLLIVVDSADKDPVSTLDIVLETLNGLGAGNLPRLVVLNKIDKSGAAAFETAIELRARGERAVCVCAADGRGFDEMLDEIDGIFSGGVAQNRAEDIL